jgi:hypothetical protein
MDVSHLKKRMGRSYFALTTSGISLLIGNSVLTQILPNWDKSLISTILYFLSIGAIIVAILIPYFVHNELEVRVKRLEDRVFPEIRDNAKQTISKIDELKTNDIIQQNDISCKCFISFPHCQIYNQIERINLRKNLSNIEMV